MRSGEVIVCPAAGAEKAHQLINTSAGELRYLSISSMNLPEVADYPDSTKFGVYSVTAAETAPPQRRLAFLGHTASGVDYSRVRAEGPASRSRESGHCRVLRWLRSVGEPTAP